MSGVSSSQDRYRRLLERKLRQAGKQQTYEDKREYYRKLGPVKTAEELELTVRGRPLILSGDQKEFLNYLWKGKIRLIAVVAGRGSGKTVALAVFTIWDTISRSFALSLR